MQQHFKIALESIDGIAMQFAGRNLERFDDFGATKDYSRHISLLLVFRFTPIIFVKENPAKRHNQRKESH
jgi:hypothetical protein